MAKCECGKDADAYQISTDKNVCMDCLFKDMDDKDVIDTSVKDIKVASKPKDISKYVTVKCEQCGKEFERFKCHPYLSLCMECR